MLTAFFVTVSSPKNIYTNCSCGMHKYFKARSNATTFWSFPANSLTDWFVFIIDTSQYSLPIVTDLGSNTIWNDFACLA